MKAYLKKHTEILFGTILVVMCILMYTLKLSDFAFFDNFETRYVAPAKEMLNGTDWINIKLNGENILNLQPLYFWIVNFSCFVFGKITTEVMRIPGAVLAVFAVLWIFKILRKILTNMYAFMISLVAATGLGFIVFSHFASPDIYAVVFITLAVFFNQKIILLKSADNVKSRIPVFLFTAAATLCCGIPGTLIPFLTVLTMNIFSGNLKRMFNPKNVIPGFIIYLSLILPWNYIMIHKHGFEFVKQNIEVCNFLETFTLKGLLIAAVIFVTGFLPWSFSFIWSLGSKYKGIWQSFISYFKENSDDKLREKWVKLNKINKFISLNTIFFFIILIFAVLLQYKYLILLLMMPASCIAGYYWYQYIVRREHNESIFFATIIPDLILIICAIIGLFGHNVVNRYVMQGMNNLIVPIVILFFIIPLVSVFAVILKGRTIPFIANVIFMFSLSFIITPDAFNLLTLNNGENDLISFAGLANETDVKLSAYIPEKKYSLIYYYDKPVEFIPYGEISDLKEHLDLNPLNHIVVEIKDMPQVENSNIKYILLDSGMRYCLIQKMSPELQKLEQNEEDKEPEVIVY